MTQSFCYSIIVQYITSHILSQAKKLYHIEWLVRCCGIQCSGNNITASSSVPLKSCNFAQQKVEVKFLEKAFSLTPTLLSFLSHNKTTAIE